MSPVLDLGSVSLKSTPGSTRAEQLARAIEDQLRKSDSQAGDFIGRLPALRSQTGLARATISEAVRLLRERGIIEIRPGRGGGLFIADITPLVRMRHTLLSVRDAPASVSDAIALREALEELIDTDAARHRKPSDIAQLRKHLKAMSEASNNYQAFIEANWKLHERIAQITPNQMAAAVYTGTLGYISSGVALIDDETYVSNYIEKRCDVHERLVDAIEAGELELTAQLVVEHNNA